MQRVLVILNPYSGRGIAARAKPAMQDALHRAGMKFDLVETTGPGHATELASMAQADGFQTVVAAGGDGTASEVLNGLARSAPAGMPVGRMGIFPSGSGNDLATMLGYPKRLPEIAQRLVAGRHRYIDIGHVRMRGPSGTLERHFGNTMGLGLEAKVTLAVLP
jgi:diacylglycerol kinase (ATP)